MAKYIKKPVEIEAIQYNGDNMDDVLDFCSNKVYLLKNTLFIASPKRDKIVNINDYIIKGIEGELYPCKPDIFRETYDLVED